jgi:hypothetical protein
MNKSILQTRFYCYLCVLSFYRQFLCVYLVGIQVRGKSKKYTEYKTLWRAQRAAEAESETNVATASTTSSQVSVDSPEAKIPKRRRRTHAQRKSSDTRLPGQDAQKMEVACSMEGEKFKTKPSFLIEVPSWFETTMNVVLWATGVFLSLWVTGIALKLMILYDIV